MANFTIIGKLVEKKDQRNATQTFVVREFVVEVEDGRDPRFNDILLFQLTGNNISIIDNFNIGDKIEVTFDLRGRTSQSKDGSGRILYFTTLNAWRVNYPQIPQQQPMQQGYAQQQPMQGYQQPVQQAYNQPMPQAPQMNNGGAGDNSDLPF
ncbi:MAG: DUF3127 domain-containing protein [Bacteroidales bacterium]|nr:DUF3127 domain-containing protein [Bacteroidales bacterium]